jgi:RNA polymerase sigma-70 factor, ECF subfamily
LSEEITNYETNQPTGGMPGVIYLSGRYMPAEPCSRHCLCDAAIAFDRCRSQPAVADADYFLRLSAPHFVTIRGVIRHILQDEADVEDTIQETLLQAFCNRNRLRTLESLRPWLIQIGINQARRKLRHNARRLARYSIDHRGDDQEFVAKETPDPRESPSELLQRGEVRTLIRQKLAKLPARERDVLVLCDLEDASADAAAKMLGVSKARVRTTLQRARAKLREDLAPLLRAQP